MTAAAQEENYALVRLSAVYATGDRQLRYSPIRCFSQLGRSSNRDLSRIGSRQSDAAKSCGDTAGPGIL